MKTLEEWNRSEELRIHLSEAMTKSPLKEAIEVCLSMEVNAATDYDPRTDIIHHAALCGATREGYFRAFRRLKSLAEDPVKPPDHLVPWEHVLSR